MLGKKILMALLISCIFSSHSLAAPIFNGKYPCEVVGSSSTEDALGNVVTFLSGSLNFKTPNASINLLVNTDLVNEGNSNRVLKGSSRIKKVSSSSSLSSAVFNVRLLESVSGIVSPTRVKLIARTQKRKVSKAATLRVNTPYGIVNLLCANGRGQNPVAPVTPTPQEPTVPVAPTATPTPAPTNPGIVVNGNFSGLYTGDETGTWSMNVSGGSSTFTVNSPSLGSGTGPCTFSSTTNFTCTVTHVIFGTTNITGSFSSSTAVSGSWVTTGDTSGTFSGTKD
jgi:hypothetical protein